MKRFINIFLLMVMVALLGNMGKAVAVPATKNIDGLSLGKLTQELGINLETAEGVALEKVLPLQCGDENHLPALPDLTEEEEEQEDSEKKHGTRKNVSAKKFVEGGVYYLNHQQTPHMGFFYALTASISTQNDQLAFPIEPKRYILLQVFRN